MAAPREQTQFAIQSRILHWLMAVMILMMLFIGVGMVASLKHYHQLVSIHRPLGILILILAVIRLVNRRLTTLPPFPPKMPAWERLVASASERLLYTLMIALPLVGWGMLSAGHYPIVMAGALHLPPILPARPALYAFLRHTHTVLAFMLSATVLAHLGAVLFHTLIVRDRLLNRMALWPTARSAPEVKPEQKAPVPKDAVPGAEKVPQAEEIAALADQASERPAISRPAPAAIAPCENPDSQSVPTAGSSGRDATATPCRESERSAGQRNSPGIDSP